MIFMYKDIYYKRTHEIKETLQENIVSEKPQKGVGEGDRVGEEG